MCFIDDIAASRSALDLATRLSSGGRTRLDAEDVLDHLEAWEPDTSPVCSPKLSTGIAKCDTCEGQSCCAEDNACANDPQFSSLMNCYNACPLDGGFPDPTCMSGCDKKYPSGANNFNAWGNCMQTNCATSCR